MSRSGRGMFRPHCPESAGSPIHGFINRDYDNDKGTANIEMEATTMNSRSDVSNYEDNAEFETEALSF